MNNEEYNDHIEEMLEEEEVNKEQVEAVEVSEVEGLKKEIEELKNKILRQAADNENFRKRITKETDDKIKYANQSLVSKFLPVMDNFDFALQHKDVKDVESVLEGVELIKKVMLSTLEKQGIKPMNAAPGEMFNPELHEAIAVCNIPDMENNVIANVIQQGYTIHDRILRSAKVQVNKK